MLGKPDAAPIMEKRLVPQRRQQRGPMPQVDDLGQVILYVARLLQRACVNEFIVKPTGNRFFPGCLEKHEPRAARRQPTRSAAGRCRRQLRRLRAVARAAPNKSKLDIYQYGRIPYRASWDTCARQHEHRDACLA
jgi:hypothetical protein